MGEPDSDRVQSPEEFEVRTRMAEEQARLAELRERMDAATARVESLKQQMAHERLNAAEQAERTAEQAEAFAAHLEANATGDGRENKLALAKREREIAALERRNAARLRSAGTEPLHLERPPPLKDEE